MINKIMEKSIINTALSLYLFQNLQIGLILIQEKKELISLSAKYLEVRTKTIISQSQLTFQNAIINRVVKNI